MSFFDINVIRFDFNEQGFFGMASNPKMDSAIQILNIQIERKKQNYDSASGGSFENNYGRGLVDI